MGLRYFALDPVLRNWLGGNAFPAGDSLLFIAGTLAALPINDLNVHTMVVLMVAAEIIGDTVNYTSADCLVKNYSAAQTRRFSVVAIWTKRIDFMRNSVEK